MNTNIVIAENNKLLQWGSEGKKRSLNMKKTSQVCGKTLSAIKEFELKEVTEKKVIIKKKNSLVNNKITNIPKVEKVLKKRVEKEPHETLILFNGKRLLSEVTDSFDFEEVKDWAYAIISDLSKFETRMSIEYCVKELITDTNLRKYFIKKLTNYRDLYMQYDTLKNDVEKAIFVKEHTGKDLAALLTFLIKALVPEAKHQVVEFFSLIADVDKLDFRGIPDMLPYCARIFKKRLTIMKKIKKEEVDKGEVLDELKKLKYDVRSLKEEKNATTAKKRLSDELLEFDSFYYDALEEILKKKKTYLGESYDKVLLCITGMRVLNKFNIIHRNNSTS